MVDAGFTSRRQAIERRAPEQHGVRAERQRFHEVGAAAIAAVDQDRRRDPRPALREDIERRDSYVEMAECPWRGALPIYALSRLIGPRAVATPFSSPRTPRAKSVRSAS